MIRPEPVDRHALLAALFAALVAVLGKVGVKNVDPTLATAVRATVMMVFLVAVAIVSGKAGGLGDIDRRSFLFIVLSGLPEPRRGSSRFVALRDGPASSASRRGPGRASRWCSFSPSSSSSARRSPGKGAIGAILVVAGAILLT